MTIQGELALAKAYEEEEKVNPFFQEKCDYHSILMNKYFFDKGWNFKNCYIDANLIKYKEEVQKIFDKIGKMMDRKFPK